MHKKNDHSETGMEKHGTGGRSEPARSQRARSTEFAENGHVFTITHLDAGRVDITITCNGDEVCYFTLDTLSTYAEKTIELELTRSGCLDGAGEIRKRVASRALAEARRVALEACTAATEDDSEAAALEFFKSPDPMRQLLEEMKEVGFCADPRVGVLLYLCKLSTLLDEPVNVYLSGQASSLKTSYADLIADLTPPEMLKHLTDLTPKALYYGATDLSHVVIVLDEMDLKGRGLALDRKLLRMLYSKGWCEIETVAGGRSRSRRVQGPVMVIQTTVATQFDEQDLSRHLLIELPDCPERTSAVLDLMGEQYAGLRKKAERIRIIEKHRSVHRMLPSDVEVVVPFAPALANLLPRDRIVVLRMLRATIGMIRASALIHSHQRQIDAEGHIVATCEDYRVIYEYAGEYLAQAISEVTTSTPAVAWVELFLQRRAERMLARAEAGEARYLLRLKQAGETDFLRHYRRWKAWVPLVELMELTGRPRTTVQRHLTHLEECGLVESKKEKRTLLYRLSTPDGLLPKCPQLPAPEDVEREMGTSGESLPCPEDSPGDERVTDEESYHAQ